MDDQETTDAARNLPARFVFSGWDREADRYLRAAWAAGLSTTRIAERFVDCRTGLQLTKNSVVGRAHRLALPKRQSPIKGGPKQGSPRPVSPVAPPAPPEPIDLRKAAGPLSAPLPRQVALTAAAPAVPRSKCCWPKWDNRPADPLQPEFCDDPVMAAGKRYCAVHHQLAYGGKPALPDGAVRVGRRMSAG